MVGLFSALPFSAAVLRCLCIFLLNSSPALAQTIGTGLTLPRADLGGSAKGGPDWVGDGSTQSKRGPSDQVLPPDPRARSSSDSHYTVATSDGIVRISPPSVIPPQPPQPSADEFVQRRGHQLVLRGKPFYFVGMNSYWFIDAASWGREHGRRQIIEACQAAQRLGMRVVRTWAFNTRMPFAPGRYDEKQFEALDFIVYVAGMHNLKLILALGNFWNAYKAPEEFLYWANPSGSYDVLDFYRDSRTRELYKDHITAILNRVNLFTGVKYSDDPTIMGWDVLNEPRCPGCLTYEQQAIAVSWMHDMASLTKRLAPNQLAALGTEGFFIDEPETQLHLLNPGPGAQCEGEDWSRIKSLPSVDFATLHVYERHMEDQPVPPVGREYAGNPDWFYCDFPCYINWAVRYIQAHLEVSESTNGFQKPLILEEFGLSWWKKEVSDRRVLLAVIYQMLADNAAKGGSFVGALFWNGAHNDTADQDGYNVKIDLWPTPVSSPPPALNRLPPILPFMREYGQKGANRPDAMVKALSNGGRRLQWQAEKLDGFRRGWERGACAHDASKIWRPPLEFVNGTSISRGTTNSAGTTWLAVPDLQKTRDYAWSLPEVDIIAWGASQVNF